jgi:hypothetical protein
MKQEKKAFLPEDFTPVGGVPSERKEGASVRGTSRWEKWVSVILQVVAVVFFLLGACPLTFAYFSGFFSETPFTADPLCFMALVVFNLLEILFVLFDLFFCHRTRFAMTLILLLFFAYFFDCCYPAASAFFR